MIVRFRKVNSDLYRGGAPTIEDTILLNRKFGIKKIVSLDGFAGKHIDRACKLLGMKHIILPIDIAKKSTLIKFLHHDLHKLLQDDGPVFVHCSAGKDRTGLAVALYHCMYDGWTCKQAYDDAVKLGFGNGVPVHIVRLYADLMQKACGCGGKHMKNSKYDMNDKFDLNNKFDVNSNFDGMGYDIASNQREYPSDYADYTLGGWEQQSWSPYEDYRVREWPYSDQYDDAEPQYHSRQDEGLDDGDFGMHDNIKMPQIGQYDQNTQGISGAGPSMVGSGYV